MKRLMKNLFLSTTAMALGIAVAAFTAGPGAATAATGFCMVDSRCDTLDPQNHCREAVFDTWCEVEFSGTCNTWSTGECEFPVD